jgi:hypothetical protein
MLIMLTAFLLKLTILTRDSFQISFNKEQSDPYNCRKCISKSVLILTEIICHCESSAQNKH